MGSSIAVLGLRRTCWAHVPVHADSGWGKRWRFVKKHSIDPDRRIGGGGEGVHSRIHLLCLCARCRLGIVKFVLLKSATSWMLPARNVSFFRRWSISDLLLLVEYFWVISTPLEAGHGAIYRTNSLLAPYGTDGAAEMLSEIAWRYYRQLHSFSSPQGLRMLKNITWNNSQRTENLR